MTSPTISCEGLFKRFGETLALDGLDLETAQGSITCFLGPNAAGKSTTIRVLLGLVRSDAGRASILGRPAGDLKALARVGSLVENPSLYPQLTGLENLRVAAHYRGCPEAWCMDALKEVRLEDAANRKVHGYSLGMRQRMGLALALVHRPELLILDEPTNGLDPAGIHEVRELIRNLALERGFSVFLSSHLLAEVEQLATHVVVIHRGRNRFQGSLEELRRASRPQLELQVDDGGLAVQILTDRGLTFRSRIGGGLLVDLPDALGAGELNTALVRSGCTVFRLAMEKVSLETQFLQLTESV